MTSSGTDLDIVNVSKHFDAFTAVDDITIHVPGGSFFALLGPSGCGKTTTLRMIAGLEAPSSGSLLLGGVDVTHTHAHTRHVNTVFQSYALFPHMSVVQNVAFGLKRRRVAESTEKAMAMLELVQLDHLAARRPSQLSGGQQQRVALARAIVNTPEVLLLDEPLGALDLRLRRQMQGEIKNLQSEVGLTFIHVTHDQEEAMTMADTVAVMNKGKVEQMGSPRELYEAPCSAFVANFLGQSNLVSGEIVEQGSHSVGVHAGGLKINARRPSELALQRAVLVGVRPEKIRLAPTPDEAPPGANVAGPGRILDVSFTGVSTQYKVDVPGIGIISVFAQNHGSERTFALGDTVHAVWLVADTFVVKDDDPTAGIEFVDPAVEPVLAGQP
ncbi:MAG: ABC transporter ATP-binding protein [Actinomycetota bacterium]|nr:ABC transporter ATP-binding protein [Actinomycetota bacterium]